MRFILCVSIVLFACTHIEAQRVSVLPGVNRVPADLRGYLQFLQKQQLDSLKQFTSYLEERVKEKKVPDGVLLNAKAILTEAEVHAAQSPMDKNKKIEELAKIYEKRTKLDSENPKQTWFGVDRVAIGKLMRSEFTRFQSKIEDSDPEQE